MPWITPEIFIADAVYVKQRAQIEASMRKRAAAHAAEGNRMIALAEAQRAGRIIDAECRVIPDVLPLPGPAPRLPNTP